MSVNASGEQNVKGNHAYRCRIPLRMQSAQPKNANENNYTANLTDVMYTRPKSASRARDVTREATHSTGRSARIDREKLLPTQRKLASSPKKSTVNENVITGNKAAKEIITVPLVGKQKRMGATRLFPVKNYSNLPDQETIKKCEDLESQQNDQTESIKKIHSAGDLEERDSFTSRSDKIMQLKIQWQEMILKFENMKSNLNERQESILQLYASLLTTHRKMSALGHKPFLPPSDDLRVMNVAKMTPEQLIQLCSDPKKQNDNRFLANNPINPYINKVRDMATKLMALCEETLLKRKEIIDWIDALKNQGCTTSCLRKKINEFNSENEMLNGMLNNVKSDFVKDLNEIIDIVSKCVNETIALQLRTEEMNCALSDIHSKNNDLRKQMYTAEQSRSHNNKGRIMELEKMLKEERLMKVTIKDRLVRTEGQLKIGDERAVQLEAALNQTRLHTRKLERTVQQLTDENHKLQLDFDKELNKLNQSIKENTTHLEEIGDAREKLQTEKEDLEKRLEELSNHYNESLDYMKEEQSKNVAKIIEIEEKYNDEMEERKKRDAQIESLCTRLVETELRYKDTASSLQEHKSLLDEKNNELQCLRNELDKRKLEIDEYRNNFEHQNNTLKEIKKNLNKYVDSENQLKCELSDKERIISELKHRQKYLEELVDDRDFKINQYEEQLSSLKDQIEELQERWTAIENLRNLPEMLSEQNTKLVGLTRQNNDLIETLEKKNVELEHYIGAMKEQEDILKQREDTIKILSDKEEEQENIIRLLKNNLEMRTHIDSEINQQLVDKNKEVESLLTNIEKYKQHIDQLEKIILTLEDKIQKMSLIKKKDEEKMYSLEKKIANYEAYRSDYKRVIENPAENLDNLIKMLEEELNTPIELQVRRNLDNLRNHNKYGSKDHESVPTKIEMGNFVKKTYVPTRNGLTQINNMELSKHNFDNIQECIPFYSSKCVDAPSQLLITTNDFTPVNNLNVFTKSRDHIVTKNSHNVVFNHLNDEKKRKMLKLIRHRL